MDIHGRYEELNRTFFEGTLPHCIVRLKSRAEMPAGLFGCTRRGAFGWQTWIRKDVHRLRRAEGRTAREILLHEMIHVKRGVDGGDEPPEILEAWRRGEWVPTYGWWDHLTREFQAGLARLAERGEAWAARERESYREMSHARAWACAQSGLPPDRWCGDRFD